MISILLYASICIHSIVSYSTKYDRPFSLNCPTGKSIYILRSEHSNRREDRRWAMQCRNDKVTSNCFTTGWQNYFDEAFDFTCPFNSIMTGFSGVHNNKREDRRFKFRCCLSSGSLGACKRSGWVNSYDEDLFFYVPPGRSLVGVKSVHNNKREDRVFNFKTC